LNNTQTNQFAQLAETTITPAMVGGGALQSIQEDPDASDKSDQVVE